METFWFFWLRFRRAYDSDYDSDFWFSLTDSDSVASENQPLEKSHFGHVTTTNLLILRKWCGFEKPNHYSYYFV